MLTISPVFILVKIDLTEKNLIFVTVFRNSGIKKAPILTWKLLTHYISMIYKYYPGRDSNA